MSQMHSQWGSFLKSVSSISAEYVGREPSLSNWPFPAKVSGEFRQVECTAESSWLQGILTHLPTLLPALAEGKQTGRLRQLVELTCPIDLRHQDRVWFGISGHALIQELFRTLPLLTAAEVKTQMVPISDEVWPQLMQLTYDRETYYLADQFDEQGNVIPFCLELVSMLKQDPSMTDLNITVWWINPTGWLSGVSPRQCFQDDPENVRRAAQQEALKNDV